MSAARTDERIRLSCATAEAEIALRGAELVSWRVNGHHVLWQGDPAWWAQSAPILFPVVGASRNGQVLVDGRNYPMPLHGFAKDSRFRVMDRQPDSLRLRLESSGESHAHFPFDFILDVTVVLRATQLQFRFDVINSGPVALPYALGFHPGFAMRDGQASLTFETPEEGHVPTITHQGLIARRTRLLPMQGNVLPLSAESFSNGAMVFRNARSNALALSGARGTVHLTTQGFRHLAVWSKPNAPFICLEAWTAHADFEDFCEELAERGDMIMLAPGQSRHHSIFLEHRTEKPAKKQP